MTGSPHTPTAQRSLPTGSGVRSQLKAAELLAAVLESSADAVTVLTLGPLTNLAELITTHPDAVDKIDLVFTMGGALETPGNVAGSGAGFDASEAVGARPGRHGRVPPRARRHDPARP